jgi:hypothetical protein
MNSKTATKRVNRRPKPGIYEDVPYDVYDSWPYVRSSDLRHAMRSAAHYRWALDHPSKSDADSPSLRFGRLVHAVASGDLSGMLIFEGPEWEAMRAKYVRPTTTREWEHRVGKLRKKHGNVEVYTADEYEQANSVASAIKTDPVAAMYFDGDTRREVSIVWDDPVTKVRCKARLDAVNLLAIIDLKTTQDASTFERQILAYHYHRQLAWYQWGWSLVSGGELLSPVLIAVETEPPFGVRSASLSERLIEAGREELEVCLARIARALNSDVWPGYANPEQWDANISEQTTVWVDGREMTW